MKSYKVVCKNYVVVESLFLLSALIQSDDWSVYEAINPFENALNSSIETLRLCSEFYINAGNFMLIEDVIESPERFLSEIKKISDVEFVYYALSEFIDKASIELAFSDLSVLKDLDEISKGLEQEAVLVIQNVKMIRESFLVALEILCAWVEETLETKMDMYDEFHQYIKQELSKNPPLEVAQILMGKTFKRISEYENFYFIPVCDAPFKCIRYFDEKTLVVVKNINFPQKEPDSIELAQFMKVLSDPTRLEILRAISKESSYGIALSEQFKVSRPTISHHIEQLNSVGLVHMERIKNTKYYSMNRNRYKEIMEALNKWLNKDRD